MNVLLLVDIQRDYFPAGSLPLPEMEHAAQNAARLLAHARKRGWRVIHIRHEERDAAAGFLLAETAGAEIHPSVAPFASEIVVTKHSPNSFHATSLGDALAGASQLFIVGAMSNMCIDATARAAYDLGCSITVVADACAASDLTFEGEEIPARTVHGAFMAALASAYGAVLPTETVIAQSAE